ncbi:pilin [Vreelandella aquamarina]
MQTGFDAALASGVDPDEEFLPKDGDDKFIDYVGFDEGELSGGNTVTYTGLNTTTPTITFTFGSIGESESNTMAVTRTAAGGWTCAATIEENIRPRGCQDAP